MIWRGRQKKFSSRLIETCENLADGVSCRGIGHHDTPIHLRTVAADARTNSSSRNTTLIMVVVIIAALYFARLILIPLALAVLLSFLLTPLVLRLRRWHLGRAPSVLLVVALSLGVVTVVGGLVSLQLGDLAQKLPEYRQNIQAKLHSVRESSSGPIRKLSQVVQEFADELAPPVPAERPPGQEKPVPVEIRATAFSPLSIVPSVLGSLASVLLMSSIVVVYVIFILFQREDLRDRLIRLVGAGRINVTTRALDDAAQRVSRYLQVQLGVNTGFGILAGAGLAILGVPNPILWGVMAALLRYVPYLGIWLAAAMPAAVSLAISPGWLEPIWIFALFFGIDLCVLNLVEPLLYGNSTGISPMAILVAAVFWTWLWGPIGLLLATPLTVCLVVLGRYVPSLDFLSIALSDEPVLSPDKRFYQRLLARDTSEAGGIVRDFLKENSLDALYDRVIVPALALAQEERHRGRLDDPRQEFLLQHTAQLLDKLADPSAQEPVMSQPEPTSLGVMIGDHERIAEPGLIIVVPARDEADELGARMLAQLLVQKGIATRMVASEAVALELGDEMGCDAVRAVCVCAVSAFGYMHARYVCKRLRAQFPRVKIWAAIFNAGNADELRKREPALPADLIATELKQAVDGIISTLSVSSETEPDILHS